MTDQTWAQVAIESCLQHGIRHFFVAPGSRCTPLTLAIARQTQAQVTQHFDERGLAFAALGHAKATRKPGVFVCTSGTAVANALPAVIEAAMDRIPLLLFTADRPDELRGLGVNQTIEQRDIFGSFPDLFLNLPVPEDQVTDGDPDGTIFLAQTLAQGIQAAHVGPVHINWKFREPFTTAEPTQARVRSQQPPLEGMSADEALPAPTQPIRAEQVREVSRPVSHDTGSDHPLELSGNTLIALGNCTPQEAQEAKKLAHRLQCPILSDVTSGLAAGSFELPNEFDLPRPDSVLHLGDRITSKSWIRWTTVTAEAGTDFLHVTSTGQVVNPANIELQRHCLPFSNLASWVVGTPTSHAFLSAWEEAAKQRNQAIASVLSGTAILSEPAIAHYVNQHCPTSAGLFLGNSMPIRDMDWYGGAGIETDESQVRFATANRGASGIDGLLATATGYANGLQQPTTVVIGDLSTLHDLNSLSLVARSAQPLIILVVNNQGGHIFDLLPIRESPHFETFFNTPHPYQFSHAAAMFGLDYKHISNMSEFRESYLRAISQPRSQIFELATDRQANMETRQQIKKAIQRCNLQD